MDNDIKQFLVGLVSNPDDCKLDSWDNFLQNLDLNMAEKKYIMNCKYVNVDKRNPEKKYSFITNFTEAYISNISQQYSLDSRYFKIRILMADYYLPEYVDKELRPFIQSILDNEKVKVLQMLKIYKNKLENTKEQKYLDICNKYEKRYEWVTSIIREKWVEDFDTIRKVTNIIKENQNENCSEELDDDSYKILEEDEVKDYLSDIMNTNARINFTSFEQMLDSIGMDTKIESTKIKCEKYYDPQGLKSTRGLFNWYAKAFVNNQSDTTDIKKYMMDNRQRLITLLIMDYYYPTYIDSYLKPFLYRSKDGDINRAKNSLLKIENAMCDMDNPKFLKLRQQAQNTYNNTVSIYNTDWDKNFKAIKQINAEIRKNETQSMVSSAVGNGV